MIKDSVRTICSHCSVKCGVVVETHDGVPVRIAGDRDHPVSKGFICVRGQAAIEYFHHPDRLKKVLRRVGARGENRWQEVPIDEAISEIADRLVTLRNQHGAEALAYLFGTYHGTDQGAGIRFMNLFGSPNFASNGLICGGPRLQGDWLTFGFGPALPDARAGLTKTIVLWSQRVSSSNAPNWGHFLNVQRAGARLVVIDPVKTPEARAADLWLPIRPGTDAALALGLINQLITRSLYDRDFVENYCHGFDALRCRAENYPVERTSEITGLPVGDIVRCAELIAEGPTTLSSGLVNGMGLNAINFERARACIVGITGNINRPGGNKLVGPPDRVLTKADIELNDKLADPQKAKRIGADRYRLLGAGYDLMVAASKEKYGQDRQLLTASRGGACTRAVTIQNDHVRPALPDQISHCPTCECAGILQQPESCAGSASL